VRTSVDVHNLLTELDIPHEIFSARGRLRTPERIAAVLDLPPALVGHVVVLEDPNRAVAAVVPSGRSPKPRAVAKATGTSNLRIVSSDRASELTGYLFESIPPAGLPAGLLVALDRRLARAEVLYFPGGEPRAVLKIRGTDLVRIPGMLVADLIQPPRSARTRGPASAAAR
jgi:prolyl-tRNA editing enzyme YbaK/EbsC (Cys-tRNA(Pro) deacylase)